ncbi:MAG: transketolase [Planctomycetota bacterium]|nr:transketolase [Planctomycetota bacterium]
MDAIGALGVGHIGGCLSLADLLAVLYFGGHMRIDPANPKMAGRDRLVMSKGHAGPAVYAALAEKGFFPAELLATLNRPGTNLPSHCDMNRTPGIDMTTGSLGQGISCAVGVALGSRLRGDGATVFAVVGDGESQEGQVWEAAMYAAHLRLSRLIAFTDYNRMQIDGSTNEINSLDELPAKWTAFGWNAVNVDDGNDVGQIHHAILDARSCPDKPSMIVLNTVKGKGVSFAEKAGCGSHNMPVTPEQYKEALAELARGGDR